MRARRSSLVGGAGALALVAGWWLGLPTRLRGRGGAPHARSVTAVHRGLRRAGGNTGRRRRLPTGGPSSSWYERQHDLRRRRLGDGGDSTASARAAAPTRAGALERQPDATVGSGVDQRHRRSPSTSTGRRLDGERCAGRLALVGTDRAGLRSAPTRRCTDALDRRRRARLRHHSHRLRPERRRQRRRQSRPAVTRDGLSHADTAATARIRWTDRRPELREAWRRRLRADPARPARPSAPTRDVDDAGRRRDRRVAGRRDLAVTFSEPVDPRRRAFTPDLRRHRPAAHRQRRSAPRRTPSTRRPTSPTAPRAR